MTRPEATLRESRSLWNRSTLDLSSDETLAQILDRGDMKTWRALYALARSDSVLRRRILHTVLTVPTPLPRFWLAALASLGESVDLSASIPEYPGEAV